MKVGKKKYSVIQTIKLGCKVGIKKFKVLKNFLTSLWYL